MLDPDVLAWRLEAEPGDDFYMTVFETRRLIEPAVAALAATRASEDEVAELEAAFARMEECRRHGHGAYIEADIRFHEVILVGCHNELLTHLGSTLARRLPRDVHAHTGRRRADAPLHAAVLAGIRDGDAEAAEAAMRALIETTARARSRRALGATCSSSTFATTPSRASITGTPRRSGRRESGASRAARSRRRRASSRPTT